MERAGLQVLVATSPENVTYTSGFCSPTQWVRRLPHTYAVYPAPGEGAPCIIASTGVLDLVADQPSWIGDVRRYGFFVVEVDGQAQLDPRDARLKELLALEDDSDAVRALARALEARGFARARIGIDEMGITPAQLDRLQAALPGATLVSAWEAFRHIRAVKTAEEVDRLRGAARIAERSIAAALAVARVGATEHDLAVAFHECTIREGGLPVFVCIGSGPRSALSNAQPAERRLEIGDVIRFDGGGRFRHYRSDIARIGTLGEPRDRVRRYHHALRAGMLAAIDRIRPGVRVAQIFDVAVSAVRKEGIPHYRRNHVGHGIGLEGYEPPMLVPDSDEVLEEGMVLCVETPYYELGFAGLQTEDTVLVGGDGPVSLMSSSSELQVV